MAARKINAIVFASWCLLVMLTVLNGAFFWRLLQASAGIAAGMTAGLLVLRPLLFLVARIHEKPNRALVWLIFDMGFIGVFGLMPKEQFDSYSSELSDIQTVVIVGVVSLCIHAVAVCIWSGGAVESKLNPMPLRAMPERNPDTTVVMICCACIIMTVVSVSLGIGRLSGASYELPFKLSGVIVLARKIALPFVLLVFAEHYALVGRRLAYRALTVFYVTWVAADGILSFSKGALLLGFAPLGFYLLHARRFKKAHLAIACALCGATTAFYNDVQAVRDFVKTTSFSVSQFTRTETDKNVRVREKVGQVATRIFKDGIYFHRFCSAVPGLWVGGIAPEVAAAGGTGEYNTRVIMRIPEGFSTSLGTAALADAYLLGGVCFCWVTVVVLSLISLRADISLARQNRQGVVVSAFVTYFLLMSLTGGFWELLVRGELNVVVWGVVPLLLWFLQRRYTEARHVRPGTCMHVAKGGRVG